MATGGFSDREKRVEKRNIMRELDELRQRRRREELATKTTTGQDKEIEAMRQSSTAQQDQAARPKTTTPSRSAKKDQPGKSPQHPLPHERTLLGDIKGMLAHEIEEKKRVLEMKEIINKKEMEFDYREQQLQKMESSLMERMDIMEQKFQMREDQLKAREEELEERKQELLHLQDTSSTSVKDHDRHDDDVLSNIDKRIAALEEEERKQELLQLRDTSTTKVKVQDRHEDAIISDIDRRIAALEEEKYALEEDSRHKDKDKNFSGKVPADLKLNLSSFSGTVPAAKNETTFEDFKLEVESVQNIYAEQIVKQNLRRALKGPAKRKLLHMDSDATVDAILAELEDNFGNVASRDTLLSRFLSAEQDQTESIVDWGLRLEEMLMQVARKSKLLEEEKRAMIRKRFWRGLRCEELKYATRVHFESSIGYVELRNKVREEEFEIQLAKDKDGKHRQGRINQTFAEQDDSNKLIKDLVKQLENLNRKVDGMQQEQRNASQRNAHQYDNSGGYQYRGGYRGNHRGGYRGNRGGNRKEDQDKQQNEKPETQDKGTPDKGKDGDKKEEPKGPLNG